MSKIVLCIITVLVISLSGCQNKNIPDQASSLSLTRIITPTINPEDTINTSTPSPTVTSIPDTLSNDPKWWKDAVFYEIYVRSFYDSNGDGIGDFNGITQKLDYLNDGNPSSSTDLGINAIWLMPIMPSPSVHGYDVTDYYTTNPQYGTMEDFKELLRQAHNRDIRLILDLPLNHTSIDNTWFVKSQDPQSPYRDWYIWSDINPGYLGPWNQVVWHPLNGAFFYGLFWEGMPDLNYKNPDVTKEIENIVRFWINDIGVDGFRLDAIGCLIEDGSQQCETSATHQWFRDFFQFYKGINPSAFTVGEVWANDEVVVPYIKNHEVDLAFNFDLSSAIIRGINEENPKIITAEIIKSKNLFPEGRYGAFVTNHDMERAATQFGTDLRKAKAAASIYLTLPDIPFIYYGEEIGMGGDAPNERIRLPMQWSSDKFADFSTHDPWLPLQLDYVTINVRSEQDKNLSLLTHYRKLISLRNSYKVFRYGEVFVNTSSNPSIYSTSLIYQDELVLVIVNLSDQLIRGFHISQSSDILPEGGYSPITLFGTGAPSSLIIDPSGRFENYQPLAQIPAYGTLIIQMH